MENKEKSSSSPNYEADFKTSDAQAFPKPWIRDEVLGLESDRSKPLTPRDVASFKNKIPFTEDV